MICKLTALGRGSWRSCLALPFFISWCLSLQIGDASLESEQERRHGMTGAEWRVATALFTAGEVPPLAQHSSLSTHECKAVALKLLVQCMAVDM